MTRYAIGDIHGGAKTFTALLDRIGLTREDRVYLLGDYIDRGPDSKGVLDTILMLQADDYDLKPIRGNHEDMLIRNIINEHDEWARYYEIGWGAETLKSFGASKPRDLLECYQNFLFSLPYSLQDGHFIFVHASLDMSKDDPVTHTKPEQMMWGNGGLISDNNVPGRIIISGHKIRSVSKISESLTQPHIQIDNGAFTDNQPELGNLVALNLDKMKLTFQPWVDEKVTLTAYMQKIASPSEGVTQ